MIHGQSVYRLDRKVTISEELIFDIGDQFYLDALHKDHLEVFNKRGKIVTVLNLDGTVNAKKASQARQEGRRI